MANIIGIDLFSGAGGLSLGAEMAGIDVVLAVEKDPIAAQTYKINHPQTKILNCDICSVRNLQPSKVSVPVILFGGPPCQGFSTSNQKTRSRENPQNWLFKEFFRIAEEIKPDWIVFENVKGIKETEKGFFVSEISHNLESLGYESSVFVLCESDYGVPQMRSRFFLIGSLNSKKIQKPPKIPGIVTVKDAIEDLPSLENGASKSVLAYKTEAKSNYAKLLRNSMNMCTGHLVSKNNKSVIERYSFIPQGGNWRNIPVHLMTNYTDRTRCHTGIYKRLMADQPSITVGNYRKSMLIHPWEDRGLSVREAARLQSFPDSYLFSGSIGFQQQQVGNAVPPLLARAVFRAIIDTYVEGDKI